MHALLQSEAAERMRVEACSMHEQVREDRFDVKLEHPSTYTPTIQKPTQPAKVKARYASCHELYHLDEVRQQKSPLPRKDANQSQKQAQVVLNMIMHILH